MRHHPMIAAALLIITMAASAERSAEEWYNLGKFYLEARRQPAQAAEYLRKAASAPDVAETTKARAIFLLAQAQLRRHAFAEASENLKALETLFEGRMAQLDSILDEPKPNREAEASRAVKQKLNSLIIPDFAFDDAPVQEVVEFLRERMRALGTDEQQVELILRLNEGEGQPPPRVSIDMVRVPLLDCLKYACLSADLRLHFTSQGAVIAHPSIALTPVETRTYTVRSSFVQWAEAEAGLEVEPDEGQPATSAEAIRRLLTRAGVHWTSESSVVHDARSGKLVITATSEELESIEAFLRQIDPEIAQVMISVSMVEITDRDYLKDLPGTKLTLDLMEQIPLGKRAVHASLSGIVLSGITMSVESTDGASLLATPTVNEGRIQLALETTMPTTDGAYTLQTLLVLSDGSAVLLPLQSPESGFLMVVEANLLNASGQKLRVGE